MQPLKEPTNRASGNEDVIKLLEMWLKRAKEHGQIGFAAIIAAENLRHVVSDYAGALDLAFAANWGLDTVKYQLLARTHAHHTEPFETPNSGSADRICYDISAGPSCYDFIVWLVLAEMNRRREKAPAPLKIGFKMINSPSERARHDEQRADFYKNVIFPSLCFVGAVPDEKSNDAPVMDKYTLRPVVELARAGEEVPQLSAPKAAVHEVDKFLNSSRSRAMAPITITLREVKGRWEHRNSNMQAWLKFAQYLEEKGERVIFVRDTDHAAEKLPGYQIYPAAAKNVQTRLALYERARANLFVSNGPMVLSLFGSRPWLMFVETDPMSVFFPETPQWWYQWQGIHNEQFPWSRPDQRIVWKRDNFENIVEAWEALEPLLESRIVEAASDFHIKEKAYG